MIKSVRNSGFSLIELMIAMVIGLLLVIGITSLFTTTSNVNRMENGLARLQENGRFALDRIADDIRMASAVRGTRKASEGGGVNRVTPDRPMLSFADFADASLNHAGLPGAAVSGATQGRYFITPAFSLRGAECAGTCIPANMDTPGQGWDNYNISGFGPIPDVGSGAGQRAAGSDVLTLRYLRGEGVELSRRFVGVIDANSIRLASPLTVGPSRLLVVGDFSTTAFVPVTASGTSTIFVGGGPALLANAQAPSFDTFADVRVSDFDTDFLTVTYYLRLENDPSRSGRLVSSLRRRENGIDVAIAEGIERLDFIYHVEDRVGNIRPMTAAEVATATNCPDPSLNPPLDPATRNLDIANCGWRAVRAIEVYLLANTIDDAGAPQEPFTYGFLVDGSPNSANAVEVACDPAYNASCPGGSVQVLPSGLPPGKMLRREFRTIVAVRNNAF